jgi:LemA protein
MKRSKKWIIAINVTVLIIFILCIPTSNELVKNNEVVNNIWTQFEKNTNEFTLSILNHLEMIKKDANIEQNTVIKVIESTAKITSATVSAKDLDEYSFKRIEQALDSLDYALSKLIMILDTISGLKTNPKYPDEIDAIKMFKNRILMEMYDYNSAVLQFNSSLGVFPKNILAILFGFHKKSYFTKVEESYFNKIRENRKAEAAKNASEEFKKIKYPEK